MRDVTEKTVATKQAAQKPKRGRGRPKKPDALTNAQRQAAYRARHAKSVTVTESLAPPASPPAPATNEALRKELDAARSIIADLEAQKARIQGELYEANQKLARAEERARKSVTRNENTDSGDTLEMAMQLLEIACKRKTAQGRMQLYRSKAWSKVHDLALARDVYRRFADCVYGPDLPPQEQDKS